MAIIIITNITSTYIMKTLSAFPYYGGKAHMAGLICEMLDYSVDTYIEPFGGACRVLLNKPRHKEEIYNDSSIGLSAFFNLMSNADTADALISEIYKTEYSKDCFEDAIKYRNSVDDSIAKQTFKQVMSYQRELLVKHKIITKYDDNVAFLAALKKIDKSFVTNLTQQEIADITRLTNNYNLSVEAIRSTGYSDLPEDWVDVKTSELVNDFKLAVSTFVIYSQSRDAMGTAWTDSKYKTPEAYYRQIDKLVEVADRLNGVNVLGPEGAISFLLNTSYLNDENVMMYLDPSYLKQSDEDKEKNRREKIAEGKTVLNHNLGKVYKQSFDYEDHEEFLKIIQKAKCKLLVSNYDVDLYNDYLTKPLGWKRIEYDTKTSVGGKKNNGRTEILWYNY